jgi:hypothetical protein
MSLLLYWASILYAEHHTLRCCMASYITWYSISMMLCINNGFVNNHVIQCYESYYGKNQIYFIFDNIITMTHRIVAFINTLWFFFL